ncbi:hypothetical protein Tco_1133624 [Tanacetum coccineum]
MTEGRIDNLTREQYLALTRGNYAPSVVKPEIGGNVNFEIKSQFMRELREDTFSGNKNDDAHEHVERVLDIVSLFNIPGVSYDAVMLRVFPITLTGAAKRWVDRLPPGTIDSWDLFKKVFIQRTNNGKFEECKAICTEDGLPLYTPFYYSLEEIKYFSSNSGFSDNEKQETDDSGMAEALAALEATLKKKIEEPKKEMQNINYYVDPYEPSIPFPR